MPSPSVRTKSTNNKVPAHSWDIPAVQIPVGLSYDDVLILPQRTTVTSRRTVDTTTSLSRNIRLNIPLCSSAMDTVTEAALAIALAQQGGIGVIHKNMSIAGQAEEVD
ncbi:MAG: IMP dehydrogenase, partial [Chloroflexota bacterium]